MMVDYRFKTVGQAAWNSAAVHLVVMGTLLCFLLGSCRRVDGNVGDSVMALEKRDHDIGFDEVDLGGIKEEVDFVQKMIKGRKEKGQKIIGLLGLLNAISQLPDGSQHSCGMGYTRRIVDAAHPMHGLLGVGVALCGLSAIAGYFGTYFGSYPEQHLLDYTAELCNYPFLPRHCNSSCNGALFLQTPNRTSYGYNWTCDGEEAKFKEVPLIAFDTALKLCREGCQQLYKSFGHWLDASPNTSAICDTFDADIGLLDFNESYVDAALKPDFEKDITIYPDKVKYYSDKLSACDILSRESMSQVNNHIHGENKYEAGMPWGLAISGAVTTMCALMPYAKAWWHIAQLDKQMATWNGRVDLLYTNVEDIEEQLQHIMKQDDRHRLSAIINKVNRLWGGIGDLLGLKLALISSNIANLDLHTIQSLQHDLELLRGQLRKLRRWAVEAYIPEILGGQKEENADFELLNPLLIRSKRALSRMCYMLDEVIEKIQIRIKH